MRRGQITMFVIIGLALLAIVGITYLALRPSTPDTLAGKQDVATVQNLVEQCLAQTGQEAIRETALQGGYYTFTGLKDAGNYESQLLHNEPQTFPLWHEIHSCANEQGCVGDNRPQLCSDRKCPRSIDGGNKEVSFQDSIERFTEDKLPACIDSFRQIPQLLVEEKGKVDVTVTIRDQDVLFTLDYPLSLTTTDNQQASLKTFTAQQNVNLPQLYDLANTIYGYERKHSFVEEQFLHLISVYAGIDSEIPPIKEAQLANSRKFWVTRNVQKTIEEQLLPFLNFIQVVNAMESYTPITSPNTDPQYQAYAAGIYDYMALKMGEQPYPLAVQFQYPGTPMYLDISGKQFLKGKELPGTEFLRIVGGLTFVEYKFKYTATFPMAVKITDPYAFDGQGLDLYYGIEANVRNNYPVNTSAEILTFQAADETLDLASPEQLTAHTFTVTVRDRHTQQPIPDAGIVYVCGTEFNMGATDARGVWTGQLPYCVGGQLMAQQEGYAGTGIPLENTADDNQRTETQVQLWPRVEKTVTLRVRGMAERALTPNETTIITVTRQAETPVDDPAPLTGVLEFGTRGTAQEKANTKELFDKALADGQIAQEDYDATMAEIAAQEEETLTVQVIDLIPGKYDITGFLTYYGLIQIPEQKKCKKVLGGLGGEECVTLPAQNFTTWNSGGVVLTEGDAVEMSEAFVYSDRNLTLYVLEQPIPTTWDELQAFQNIEDYQSYGRAQLVQPER